MLVSTIFMLFSFAVMIFRELNFFNYTLKKFLRNKYVVVYFLFILWTILSSLILTLSGKTTIKISALNIFLGLFFSVMFPLYFGFCFAQKFKIKKILKILYISIFIIVLFGLVDFLGFTFSITPLKEIMFFLVNQRILDNNTTGDVVKVMVGGIPRVQSLFVEPGLFSYFMALIAPFIYKMSRRKYQLFENKYFDVFIKYSCPVLAGFDVLLTMSPIGILFNTFVYAFFFVKTCRKKKFIQMLLFIFPVFLLGIMFFDTIPSADKVLSRVITIKYLFTHFDQFTILEESLATRLVLYINCICIFLKNPLLGVGWGHLGLDLNTQLLVSPVPITFELIRSLQKLNSGTTYGLVISYRILAETGIIGFSLFYAFIVKILLRIRTLFHQKNVVLADFVWCFYYYTIFFIAFSFYESLLYAPHYWVFFGIIISAFSRLKRGRNGRFDNISKL